jgi:hypothetical protein
MHLNNFFNLLKIKIIEQTDTGASAPSPNSGLSSMQPGDKQFTMQVPNNKVNLLYFSSL